MKILRSWCQDNVIEGMMIALNVSVARSHVDNMEVFFCFYFHPLGSWSIVMTYVCVCLSVYLSARITRNPRWRTSPIFLSTRYSSSDGFRYVMYFRFYKWHGPPLIVFGRVEGRSLLSTSALFVWIRNTLLFSNDNFLFFFITSVVYMIALLFFFEKHFKRMFLFYYFLRNNQQIIFTYMTIVMSSYVTYLLLWKILFFLFQTKWSLFDHEMGNEASRCIHHT